MVMSASSRGRETAKTREVQTILRHGSVDGPPLAPALGDSRVYVCPG